MNIFGIEIKKQVKGLKLKSNVTIEDELSTIELIVTTMVGIHYLNLCSKVCIAKTYLDYDFSKFEKEDDVLDVVALYEFLDGKIWDTLVKLIGKSRVDRIINDSKQLYLEKNNPLKNIIPSEDELNILKNFGENYGKKDSK